MCQHQISKVIRLCGRRKLSYTVNKEICGHCPQNQNSTRGQAQARWQAIDFGSQQASKETNIRRVRDFHLHFAKQQFHIPQCSTAHRLCQAKQKQLDKMSYQLGSTHNITKTVLISQCDIVHWKFPSGTALVTKTTAKSPSLFICHKANDF